MEVEGKSAIRINKRHLTVCYSHVGKRTLEKALSTKTKCDGYMIVAQEKGCLARLYRKKKYNFVSLTPSFLRVGDGRGLIVEDISDEDFKKLDGDYVVDGSFYVKKIEVKPYEEQREVVQIEPAPLQTQITTATQPVDFSTFTDMILRAFVMKRKQEYGLDEESIKTLNRDTMLLLLS